MRRGRLFYKGPVSEARRFLRGNAADLQPGEVTLEDPRQMRLLDTPPERCECAHGRSAHVQGSGACTVTRACDCATFRLWTPPYVTASGVAVPCLGCDGSVCGNPRCPEEEVRRG